jgi:tetratricopeptide (TPR) repeat protein
MKIRNVTVIVTVVWMNLFIHPSSEARLFTARLMGHEEENWAQTQPVDSTASMLPADAAGELSFESATRLVELANHYRDRGQYAHAEVILKDLLAMRQRARRVGNPEIAGYMSALADVYFSKQDYARAEPLYLQSLAISEKSLGLQHRDVAGSLRKLADLYVEQARYQEAQPLYARALAILEPIAVPEDPELTAVRARYTALLTPSERSAVKVRESDTSTDRRQTQ